MTTKTCIYCQRPFTPPQPTTTMCEHCWYSGRDHGAKRAELIYALSSLAGVDDAYIEHTGGGCFGLAIYLTDGSRFLFATNAYQDSDGTWSCEASVPDAGEPWALGIYRRDADSDAGYCGEEAAPMRLPLTDAELIAAVREIAGGSK